MDRYTDPLRALWDLWWVKAVAALVALLFHTEAHLILAVIALLTIDWVTGVMAARRRGEAITSGRMRKTFPKGVDYALFVGSFIVVANAFPIALGWCDEWAYGFVALTEVKSIVENVWGERASEVWGQFQAFRRARGGEPGSSAGGQTKAPPEATDDGKGDAP